MALEKHIVELSARDTLTPVLKKVGTEAESAGRKADDAGKRASRSMADWGRAASALGLAIGAGIGSAIKISNEAEVVQARLRTSIENTGHAYDEYADAIDKASQAALDMAFDDEDAANSIAALTDATGDASKAINDLALAQDIARGRGIDLAAATQIVIAAETGRFQSLKRLGIAVDENATKEEVLASLQAKYAGQAQAYAETNQATWDRLGNTLENTLESIGGHLADFQGPLVALSAGATALGPLGQAFEALDGKAKLASLGSKALASAWMGPAGIAVAAGVAGVAIYELMTRESDHERQVRKLEEATDEYRHTLADLTTELVRAQAYDLTQDTQAFLDVWINNGQVAQQRIDEFLKARDLLLNEPQALSKGLPNLEGLDDYTKQVILASDANHDMMLSSEEADAALRVLQGGFELTAGQAADLQKAYTGLLDDIANPELYGTEIAKQAQKILEDVVNGVIDVETGIKRLNALPLDPKFNKALQEQKRSVDDLNESYGSLYNTLYGGVNAIANNKDAVEEATKSGHEWAKELDLIGLETGKGLIKVGGLGAEVEKTTTTFDALGDGLQDAAGDIDTFTGKADEGGKAMQKLADDVDALNESLSSITPPDVLKSTFGAIVGYTNDIVGSIDQVKAWSDALMAPLGTDFQDDGAMSKMLDLLQRGKIDTEDYNEALDAQRRIYGDLARAQDAQAIIQIKQANFIADATDATADYLENISKLPEAEQATALAWADSDISGRAQDIADMASEWDNMSEAQRDAFEETTLSAAKLDPLLANLLFQMGVLKGDINDPSSWTLSLDTSKAQDPLDKLTESINNLVTALEITYKIDINGDGVIGVNEHIKETQRNLDGLDDNTPVVTVDDDSVLTAHGDITLAQNALNTLDGDSAGVSVHADTGPFWGDIGNIADIVATRYISITPTIGYERALGGTIGYDAIDTAALGRVSGGNLTLVGEHGPELVNLPGGSFVTPNHATRYDDRARGGGGLVINELHIHGVQNPKQFMDWQRQYSSAMERQ